MKLTPFVARPLEALPALAAIDARHPGLAEAINLVAGHESGWNPRARLDIPGAHPAGLLQWMGATSRAFGGPSKPADIAALPLLEQLALAERYSVGVLRSLKPTGWHLWARGWGFSGNPNGPDETVVYLPDTAGAKANPAFQSADGSIRLGTLRRHWNKWVAARPGPVEVEVPAEPPKVEPAPPACLCSGCPLRPTTG